MLYLRKFWYRRLLAVEAVIMAILVVTAGVPGGAQTAEKTPESSADLTNISLEDLANIEVTSVSKRSEKLSESPAAIYVVTGEDIRRAGVTSVPEALRMVPGMHVARIDSNKWMVNTRGFSDRFSNKLLVLIDGRSVYAPIFTGVWWDAQDIPTEDIDRIEVIRGPGATMWGANAVNGVINIITKSSRYSQGTYLSTFTGGGERSITDARYGGKNGENSYYRVYAKAANHGNFADASGDDTSDSWQQQRAGFRADTYMHNGNTFTLQGDTYNGTGNQTLLIDSLLTAPKVDHFSSSGANLLARWSMSGSARSHSEVQFYYDRTKRDDLQHGETRDTVDIEYQQNISPCSHRQVTWGLGYRFGHDSIRDSEVMQFDPAKRNTYIANAFIQEDITIPGKPLKLIVGTKFEHDTYTGLEIQPNARMVWTPDDRSTVWGAVSRAVRTPSRTEQDCTMSWVEQPGPGGVPMILRIYPNSDYGSEVLTAWELGYRIQPKTNLSFDFAGFYNVYDDYRTFEPGTPFPEAGPIPHLILPLHWKNLGEAKTYGVETAANWSVSPTWRLAATYSFLQIRTSLEPTSHDFILSRFEANDPHHQFSLYSSLDLPRGLELDTQFYFTGPLSNSLHPIPQIRRLDVRLAWHPRRDMDISIGGRNLLQSRHQEFFSTYLEVPTDVERSYYAMAAYEF